MLISSIENMCQKKSKITMPTQHTTLSTLIQIKIDECEQDEIRQMSTTCTRKANIRQQYNKNSKTKTKTIHLKISN